jgi:UbiD family decarboxylase
MGLDFDRFRLRSFLDTLREAGELEMREDPVDLADIAAALEANPKAVLFRKVGPEGWELAGNVMGSRARLALAFGTLPAGLLAEVLRRLRLPPQIVEVPREQAPVQRALHLFFHRLRDRSHDGLDQRRRSAAHAARPARDGHRSRLAERPARPL